MAKEGTKLKAKRLIAIATGAAAIAMALNPGLPFRLIMITLHLSTAIDHSETLTVTFDAGDGSAYDTLLYSRDLNVGSITDLIVEFDDSYDFEADDHIDIALANVDTKTYGLRIVYELV